jgi:hypothetical protein
MEVGRRKLKIIRQIILFDAERKELAMFQKKEGNYAASNKEKLQGQLNAGFEEFWMNYRYK